jgi:ABC-2 type transport system ATP-binding protein
VRSSERHALAFRIGTVFGQRSQLWYQLPPRDTFALLGRVYEVDPTRHRRRMDELIALFGLGALVDTPVRQLSLGERMRCEIVASVLHAPRLLFLDEPTIGLDVSAKAAIRELLRAESERDGVTLLLTSHDTGDIERVCDRVVVIHRGRLLWDGRLADLRRSYLAARRVTLWTEAERLDLSMAGVRVLASSAYRTELEVDVETTSLGSVVDAALRQGAVRDLTVEDAPLDVVIRALYGARVVSREHRVGPPERAAGSPRDRAGGPPRRRRMRNGTPRLVRWERRSRKGSDWLPRGRRCSRVRPSSARSPSPAGFRRSSLSRRSCSSGQSQRVC